MPAKPAIIASAGILLVLAAPGCKNKARAVSDSDYLLGLLRQAWAEARTSLQSAQPQLGKLYSVEIILTRRLARRAPKDYAGPNPQQVLQKVESLSRQYQAEVSSKLQVTSRGVELKPGASLAGLRQAFMKLDPEYQELDALTAGRSLPPRPPG